jgi:hypothetical protein
LCVAPLLELNLQDAVVYNSMFQAARAFATMAPIWGGLTFVWVLLVVCACFSKQLERREFWLSGLFLLAATCQGLSFLLLGSNLCSPIYMDQYINSYFAWNATADGASTDGGDGSGGVWVSTVTCGSSRGAHMAIVAILLYCTCVLLASRATAVTITESFLRHQNVEDGDERPCVGDDDLDESNPGPGNNGEKPSSRQGQLTEELRADSSHLC